jgi:class 3 adenylate cyclase
MPMAVMFLDICGFSGRPADTPADQDVLLRALNLFFTEMFRIAEDYGGTVEKNTGDGLMAYFEDQASDGRVSGCQRAVAAALTMMYTNTYGIGTILRHPESPS